jgi:trehalose 6-phosphate phosphatase
MLGGAGPLRLEPAVVEMMRRDRVMLAVDFDGTLAPIVERPDLAEPDAAALSVLRDLAMRPRIEVVIISGRTRADLRSRLGEVPGATLIGEHGNDTGTGDEALEEIEDARAFLTALAGSLPGSLTELKGKSVTLHTRGVDRGLIDAAGARIRAWVRDHGEFVLLEGKEVFEISVSGRTKGDAIEELRPGVDGVIFIGDDVTDETVFRTLRPDDVGIKVGQGATSARYRVDDVAGVLDVLEVIALASR